MIARHWKGVAHKEKATSYLKHLEEDTFSVLKGVEGFIDVHVLKREVDSGIEFIVISTWQSMDVIEGFAGDDIDKAVVPDVAKDMLLSYDKHVNHYEIALSAIN